MSLDWWLPAAVGLLTLLAVVLVVSLSRLRARTRRDLAAARAESAALRAHLEELEHRLPRPTALVQQEFRITSLGEQPPEQDDGAGAPMDRQLFTDLLLRESVVRIGSLAHGVRRALQPEVRNRIRFEVKREIKRSRKSRKDEVREAVRQWRAQQRSEMSDADDGDVETMRHTA
jgi:hypothetical protein